MSIYRIKDSIGGKRIKNEKDNWNPKCRDINPGTQKYKISKSDAN